MANYELDSVDLSVNIAGESNITAQISDTQPLNVTLGKSAEIDVGQAVVYIESGKAELQPLVTAAATSASNAASSATDAENSAISASADADRAETAAATAENMANKDLSNLSSAGEAKFAAKQDVISDLSTIRSGAEAGATAVQPADLATVATTGAYNDLSGKPTLATVATSGSYNDLSNKPTIPTTAADVSALPSSTKYGASIDLSLNTTNYKLTLTLKDQDNSTLNSKVVDFPIESVVVNGSYDNTNKKIVLTLQNGNTIDIPVGDLVSGLQTEITALNKIDSDYVDDSSSANKFVSATDKTNWNSKQNQLVSGVNIKTVNNQSLLGSGNINISGADGVAKLAEANTFTAANTFTNGIYLNNGTYDLIKEYYTNAGASWELRDTNNKLRVGIDADYLTIYDSSLNERILLTGSSSLITLFDSNGYFKTRLSDGIFQLNGSEIMADGITGSATSGSTNLITSGGVYSALSNKQNKLVSGTNIKTINNQSILGSGNLEISGGGGTTYTAGTGIDITNNEISVDTSVIAQQSDIPTNNNQLTNGAGYITSSALSPYVLSSSLATVATTGNYSDLSGTPTIPSATSDLTNDSGFITSSALTPYVLSSSLATVATTGSYNDLSNKPTIPAAQVQSNWTQSDNTEVDYIKNKPTLATVATSGDYDDLSNKPTIPTVDSALSSTSTNPVQNKVIYTALGSISTNQGNLSATGSVGTSTVAANLTALDSAIGYRNYISNTKTVSYALSDIKGKSVASIAAQLSSNIGLDTHLTTAISGGISASNTINQNLKALDTVKQDVSNLVTSVSSSSTDSQYPSAKLFYDTCGDIETLINAL